jgi:putative transposase
MGVRGTQRDAQILERVRIIETARRCGVAAAAREHACSRTTVYALLARFERGGPEGLVNRPRGPREPVAEDLVELIVTLKVAGPHRSTSKIQQLLQETAGLRLSRQSVWRVLAEKGLTRLLEPSPLIRFERPAPNQLWQMDLKEDVPTPAGKAHLLAVIDDASRFCLGGEWIARKSEPAILGALATILRRWGLPEAILTDRAGVFYGPATRQAGLTTYQLALEAMGVKARFAKAYKPRTKGKIEKFIQLVIHDFLREVADQVQSVADLERRWQAWLPWYNERRPHSSLGHLPPSRRFQAPGRAAPEQLERLLRVEVSRKVSRDATISVRGQRYEVPPELIGRHVWVGLLGRTLTIEHGAQIIASYTI